MTERLNKRRNFLKLGGGSLGLSLGLGLGAPARADGVDAAATNGFAWSAAAAQALVGQRFWLNHPDQGAVELVLEAVAGADTAQPAAHGALQQFTLLFAGPAGNGCAAGTYEMDHAAIGRFALYLAPAAKRTGANTYRAEFSLLA